MNDPVPRSSSASVAAAERAAQSLVDAYRAGDAAARRRFAGRHPRFARGAGEPTAGDARLVVAGEAGYANWPKLAVDLGAAAVAPEQRVDAFLACSWAWGDWERSQALLRLAPGMGEANLYTACVLGDADQVAAYLQREPELARRSGGPRNWPPLLYVCWSAYLGRDEARSEGLVRCAALLLEHGADPNSAWRNPEGDVEESALYGACGIANHAPMTRLLLDAGADPNDGESFYHACEHFDTTCLELLHRGAQPLADLSYMFKHVIDYRYTDGVRWFLDHGADPNHRHPASGETALHWAVKRGFGCAVIGLLLDHGADPNARTDRGLTCYPEVRAWTAHDLALRLGQGDVAALLERRGAIPAEQTELDRLVVACARGDRDTAHAILSRDAGLIAGLDAADAALMAHVAQMNNLPGVQLMVAAGFDVNAAGWMDATPLHWAACRGNPAMLETLLQHGAAVAASAPAMSGTPLCTAVHQQWESAGDYPEVIRLLIQAGAAVPEALYPTGSPAIDALIV